MTKSEALEFLELPETATDSEIKIRIEDKLAYFERLSEKAPSDFLRRLHARNASKVSEIQMASKKWPSYVPPVQEQPEPEPEIILQPEPLPVPQQETVSAPPQEVVSAPQQEAVTALPPEPEAMSQEEPKATSQVEPEPVQADPLPQLQTEPEPQPELEPLLEVQSTPAAAAIAPPVSASQPTTVPDPPPAPKPILVQADPEPVVATQAESQLAPVAWLIRHTENQSSKTFPLYPGRNYLGRKPREGLTPFIEVEEDPYISKVHAVLYAENGDIYVSDPSGGEGKPSKNGIFINADENRLMAKTRLWEKDTVQIGVTKLILRYNSKAIVKIVKEVEEQDYMHTVVIDIS